MRQILTSWNTLSSQKQIVLVLALLATLVTVFSLYRVATKTQFELLYSGLDSTTISEIVASLDQKSIGYEVRGNSVYVDAALRDRARIDLAGEGLPSNGVAGYELLDSLSGFGTTSQMFDAAYWRAKEGELARTILASNRIKTARVHIANPVSRPFERNVKPTASITVIMKSGELKPGQARAIRYLVASAVAGLEPAQVAVIDANYGVILQPGETTPARASTGGLDARAEALRTNVERLLSARVGRGNVIVEVMVEAQTDTQKITERVLDPNGSVPVSSETVNNTDNSTGGGAGAVTVASNLPDTSGASGTGKSARNQVQSHETIKYDVSETVRERTQQPGDIARLSVAVLVNGETTTGNDGKPVYTPRSKEELAAFQTLVQSTVGFKADRGDVVTIETMKFPSPPVLGTAATQSFLSGFAVNLSSIIQMAFLGFVALALGMFVIRPILNNPAPQLTKVPAGDLEALRGDSGVIDGSAINHSGALSGAAPPPDPLQVLRDTLSQRADESSHLLRNWIEAEPNTRSGTAT